MPYSLMIVIKPISDGMMPLSSFAYKDKETAKMEMEARMNESIYHVDSEPVTHLRISSGWNLLKLVNVPIDVGTVPVKLFS
jgi:hypothetical protein